MRMRVSAIVVALVLAWSASGVQAQETAALGAPTGSKPVMQSVFWNTVWGSAWGALIGTASSFYSYNEVKREPVISGTTIGAVMGYGMGIYLILNGITFDKRFLLNLPAPEFGPVPQASLGQNDPFQTQASAAPVDPSAWQVSLFEIRF